MKDAITFLKVTAGCVIMVLAYFTLVKKTIFGMVTAWMKCGMIFVAMITNSTMKNCVYSKNYFPI